VTIEFHTTPLVAAANGAWQDLAVHRAVPLDPALRPAFLADGPAAQALERLYRPGALCVTTGQQPGLFLGPLFTVYKALTTVALARRLERRLGRPVVPVFWVAGDDHDFAEAGHTFLLSQAGEPTRLALPDRAADAALTPMYREALGPAVEDLVARFWAEQPATEFRPEIEGWLRRHYVPAATVAEAFATAIGELLSELGLVVFRPTHPAAKAVMRPCLLDALAHAGTLDAALAGRAQQLTGAGRPAPVAVGEGATLVMLEGSAGRDRLVLADGAFHTRRAGERYTLAELRRLADEAPERLSPNVLLRPVVEAAMLPTLAYVGGPGEVAYFPQCEPIYAALGVRPQAPVARWSAVVIEARVRKVLDRYGIALDDLRLPEGQLEQRLVRGEIPPDAQDAIEVLRRVLEDEYGRLRDAAVAIDPTLQKAVESSRNAALAGTHDLEKRLLGHLKQRNETLLQQIARARNALYPFGRPQERVFGPVPFLVRYGGAFLTEALAQADAWAGALEAAPDAP
jgi:bacillithiol biosynthesis cysteine-adding enzyme BshC